MDSLWNFNLDADNNFCYSLNYRNKFLRHSVNFELVD